MPRTAAVYPQILLPTHTGLGNFILKTPLIAALHQAFPNVAIDLVGSGRFGAELVVKQSPLIRKVHQLRLSEATWRQKCWFWVGLRSYSYDYILLPFDIDSRFWRVGARIAGIRHIVRQPKQTLLPDRHEIDYNIDLLAQICPDQDDAVWRKIRPFVHCPPDERVLQRYKLEPRQYIVIQPGAANGLYAAKVWSPNRFKALIPELIARYQMPLVLVGDAGDNRVFAQALADSYAQEPLLINTAGQTSFDELVALLANARAVLCHDSGVMHLSDALETPLIALYGPTDYSRTHPRGSHSHTLLSETPYQGIMRHFATDEIALSQKGIGHAAMDGISVTIVLNKLAVVMQEAN